MRARRVPLALSSDRCAGVQHVQRSLRLVQIRCADCAALHTAYCGVLVNSPMITYSECMARFEHKGQAHTEGSTMAATPREMAIGFQGMRCGHIDGKARVGVYVTGEEELRSLEAANNMRTDYRSDAERRAARFGYERGYVCGAAGDELPAYAANAALPEACDAQPVPVDLAWVRAQLNAHKDAERFCLAVRRDGRVYFELTNNQGFECAHSQGDLHADSATQPPLAALAQLFGAKP